MACLCEICDEVEVEAEHRLARPAAMAAHVYDIDEVLEERGGNGAGEDEILKGEQQNERWAFEEERFGLQAYVKESQHKNLPRKNLYLPHYKEAVHDQQTPHEGKDSNVCKCRYCQLCVKLGSQNHVSYFVNILS